MELRMPERSMLDQPKTKWVCSCGATVFEILLCPDHVGTDDSHIIGFQCVGCETIHSRITDLTYEEFENVVH